MISVVCSLILIQGVISHRTYFEEWAAAPEVYPAYEQEWTDLAPALNAQSSAADMVFLIPYSRAEDPYGFTYLYKGASPVHLVPAATSHNLVKKIESTLTAMETVSTAKVVDWKNELVGGDSDLDERIVALMGKYGHYLCSEDGSSFRIHTYSDFSLDRHWRLYEPLEPTTVHYVGGISLLGLALGQGAEQLFSPQILDLRDKQSVWMVL